ncbi:hypothetical protein [Riemerella columbipharyngis]|uniref:Conjugative transposon TraJ C-terminal domain-containing protein n=1 Tax=Riemerella columbipharyngis TaxID=1071918 RepID=A0A1G6ZC92_9FLAO|nr:hypothetical protein [Riemerella columbipharyngis]SDD99923.1 hypothetical protein SAMN05421544_10229 [Riemerella columbipharyngis]
MKRKLVIFGVFAVVILVPVFMFGQNHSDSANTLKFLQGDGAIEKWFIEIFDKLQVKINDQASAASLVGRAIGSLGMLMYMGYLGWRMQEGMDAWSVTPMIKPIIVGMILINWVPFTRMLQAPFEALGNPTKASFKEVQKDAEDLRAKKFELQNKIIDFIIEEKVKDNLAKKKLENDKDLINLGIDDKFNEIMIPIEKWSLSIQFRLQKLVASIIEFLGLAILRICIYLIFFIQKIWVFVLIVLGPFAIGISLIPGFESSMNNWIAKFININLYTFIAYTIMNIGQELILAGYHMQIDRLNQIVNDSGTIDKAMAYLFISKDGLIYDELFPIVAYLITAIGILMTPTIADTIVSAGGAGIMSKAKSAATTVQSKAKGAASGIAKGGRMIGNVATNVGGKLMGMIKK